MTTANIRQWHSPKNSECEQNKDISQHCTCKLVINGSGKKKHKPRIIFRVHDDSGDLHKVKADFVIEIHENGKLTIREAKRRAVYETTVAKAYCRFVRNYAFQQAVERARKRREKSKASKAARKLALRQRR